MTESVVSKDGGTISYTSLGHGPGLIILHGALQSSHSHTQLAEALSPSFTVYLPNRRGRGASSTHDASFSLQTEVDDLEALLLKTGAHLALGVSSGALITLQAAMSLPAGTIRGAVLFEPPLLADFPRFKVDVKQFDEEIARGEVAAALVTALGMTEMGPWICRFLPRWILTPLVGWVIEHEDVACQKSGVPSMIMLAPTMHYDFQLVREMEGPLERFRGLGDDGKKVLLLSGTASPEYWRRSVDELEKAIPGARHVRLEGLDHLGTGNKDVGGEPGKVARVVEDFFLGRSE
jgi:pimeloyl-ACP methyl ester carboxylesterase